MNELNYIRLGMRQKSGERCKVAGVWRSDTWPATNVELTKGQKFPKYLCKSVIWILVLIH